MKVILLQDVRKLGKKGDIVKVADGYGQNYLIKNKLAVLETNATRKVVENEKQLAHEEDLKRQDDAKQLAKRLEDITLEFSLKSGKDGKTFGSVSTKQIVEQLREKYDIKIDKRKMELAQPIRSMGYVNVPVKLHNEVSAKIRVHIAEQ